MEWIPVGLESMGVVMSNFDHEIEAGAEEKLKTESVFGEYTAWNFWAVVWFANNVFKCAVKQYGHHIDTFSGGSLREIMTIASDKYGGK